MELEELDDELLEELLELDELLGKNDLIQAADGKHCRKHHACRQDAQSMRM